jgi:hypothetical protein
VGTVRNAEPLCTMRKQASWCWQGSRLRSPLARGNRLPDAKWQLQAAPGATKQGREGGVSFWYPQISGVLSLLVRESGHPSSE